MYLGLVAVPLDADVHVEHAGDEPSRDVHRHSTAPDLCRSSSEREMTYDRLLPHGSDLRTISTQILDVGRARRRSQRVAPSGWRGRDHPRRSRSPARLTFTPATRRLVIERMIFRSNAFLERFHRRRGYATGYGLDTGWAVAVDLAITAMVFWVVSGLWMWWEMKVTRGDSERCDAHRGRRALRVLSHDDLTRTT